MNAIACNELRVAGPNIILIENMVKLVHGDQRSRNLNTETLYCKAKCRVCGQDLIATVEESLNRLILPPSSLVVASSLALYFPSLETVL